jgi:hypothetical protein
VNLPGIDAIPSALPNMKRLFIGAYGFEERAWEWLSKQKSKCLASAILVNYANPKGNNRKDKIDAEIKRLRVKKVNTIDFNINGSPSFEINFSEKILPREIVGIDEVVVDISALNKFLILVILCCLEKYNVATRIVYTEAEFYSPAKNEYDAAKDYLPGLASLPSFGVNTILRATCLSSIRMQGQPVVLIAFTSFNEQLVRYIIGTINPHRLIFVNGIPPRGDFAWRAKATQAIHQKLIDEYSRDNPVSSEGDLLNSVCTLDYRETVNLLSKIYSQYGSHERLICAATGSKMQTVGLYYFKRLHPDIHIEYPGVHATHQILIPSLFEKGR